MHVGVVIGLMFVSIVVMAAGQPTSRPLAGKVVCVGDSLTFGEGVKEEENFVSRLGARSGAVMINQGRSGWSTAAYLRRSKEVVEAMPADADMILIQLGANDLRESGHSEQTARQCAANMEKIIGMLHEKAPGARVVLMASPTMFLKDLSKRLRDAGFGEDSPRYLKMIRDEYEKLATKMGLRFVSLYEALSEGSTLDGAHPTAGGHREIADTIWTALSPAQP